MIAYLIEGASGYHFFAGAPAAAAFDGPTEVICCFPGGICYRGIREHGWGSTLPYSRRSDGDWLCDHHAERLGVVLGGDAHVAMLTLYATVISFPATSSRSHSPPSCHRVKLVRKQRQRLKLVA